MNEKLRKQLECIIVDLADKRDKRDKRNKRNVILFRNKMDIPMWRVLFSEYFGESDIQ